MKKINLDQVLIDLKGEEIKDGENGFTMGKALANIMLASKEGGKMKLYILGTKFYTGGNAELDASDFSLVLKTVKASEAYGSLIVGQVETILESYK